MDVMGARWAAGPEPAFSLLRLAVADELSLAVESCRVPQVRAVLWR